MASCSLHYQEGRWCSGSAAGCHPVHPCEFPSCSLCLRGSVVKKVTAMPELQNPFNALQSFTFGPGRTGRFYSLPELEKQGVGPISRLPVSIRIVLESILRSYDGRRIREADVRELANWKANAERTAEIPFVVA